MIKRIRHILQKKTLQHLFIVFMESVFSRALAFVLMVVLAKKLGPEGFGVYSLVTVSVVFLMSLLDFGLENAAVRFSAHYQGKKDEIFGLYMICKTAGLFVLLGAICLVPGLVARLVSDSKAKDYLSIIFLGSVIESYLFILTTYLQSVERFLLRAFINTGVFVVRCAVILSLLALGKDSIKLIALCFVLSGLPFILFNLRTMARFIVTLKQKGIPKKIIMEMAHYQKWIITGAVPMIVMSKIDFYAVSYFMSIKETGLYNAAVQFTAVLSVVLTAFRRVLLPKVSKYNTSSQMATYVKRVEYTILAVCLFTAVALPLSKFMVTILLGRQYAPSAVVLQILLIANVFTFWNVLLSILFYAMGKANIMAVGAYLQLAVFVAVAFAFPRTMGMTGVAWSKLISDGVYLAWVLYYLPKVMREKPSAVAGNGLEGAWDAAA